MSPAGRAPKQSSNQDSTQSSDSSVTPLPTGSARPRRGRPKKSEADRRPSKLADGNSQPSVSAAFLK